MVSPIMLRGMPSGTVPSLASATPTVVLGVRMRRPRKSFTDWIFLPVVKIG